MGLFRIASVFRIYCRVRDKSAPGTVNAVRLHSHYWKKKIPNFGILNLSSDLSVPLALLVASLQVIVTTSNLYLRSCYIELVVFFLGLPRI